MDRQAAHRRLILANTTPLIALAQRDLFDLLRVLYEQIGVPSAVYREVVTEGQGRAGSREVEAAIAAGWIEVMALYEPEAAQCLRTQFLLGDGESEVLALAQERPTTLILMDEARGVRWATARGHTVLRTVGSLLQAKRQGLLSTVQSHLDALRAEGFRLSDSTYRAALQQAGESL